MPLLPPATPAGVADLAAEAGRQLGLPEARHRVAAPRCASSTTWAASGCRTRSGTSAARSTPSEMERVRLHPYLTERMLAFSPALAPLGAHRQRSTTSGWTAAGIRDGLTGDSICSRGLASWLPPTRYQRHARARARTGRREQLREAAAELRREVASGRLDGEAVNAVLGAQPATPCGDARREWPAGLTQREVEVLRLVARGFSNEGDRRPARDLAEDRSQPRRAHLREDRRAYESCGKSLCSAARSARGGRSDGEMR